MITDMAVFEVVVVLVRLSSKQFISDTHQPFRQTFLHNLDYIVMMSVLSIWLVCSLAICLPCISFYAI